MSLAIETVSYDRLFLLYCLGFFFKFEEDFLQGYSTICCIAVILYIGDVI